MNHLVTQFRLIGKKKTRTRSESSVAVAERMRTSTTSSWTYTSLLARYPLVVLTLQTAVVQIASRLTVGLIDGSTLSLLETVVTLMVGCVYINPMLMIFFGFIQTDRLSPFSKVLIDQLVFSPMFTFGLILFGDVLRCILEGGCKVESILTKIAPKVIQSTVSVIPIAWLFWIPQRAFSQKFVPPLYQLPFNQFSSFWWTVIFQWMMRKR